MSGKANGFDSDGNPVQYGIGGGVGKSFLKPEISDMIKRGEKREDKEESIPQISGELREKIASIIFRNDYKGTAWEDTPQLIKTRFLREADAIISIFLAHVERVRPKKPDINKMEYTKQCPVCGEPKSNVDFKGYHYWSGWSQTDGQIEPEEGFCYTCGFSFQQQGDTWFKDMLEDAKEYQEESFYFKTIEDFHAAIKSELK
ncbi:MAG: hypothetical protein PHY46_05215 [Candidatus Omnitrophica bacterium]|nr:hypothetical protein [Candidatus Omnitrophota bacterium]